MKETGYISRKCRKCANYQPNPEWTPEFCDQCRLFWPSMFRPKKEAEQE